jgi:prefoldin subunit 5
MKKTIDELEDYKQELEESLKMVHDSHVPSDWIEHRKNELMYEIQQLENAIEDLRKTNKMYVTMSIIMYLVLGACGAFLLWAYLTSE